MWKTYLRLYQLPPPWDTHKSSIDEFIFFAVKIAFTSFGMNYIFDFSALND